MYSYVLMFIAFYVRPIYKWFLRRTTGLCELQRICYGRVNGAPRITAVEQSLGRSRSPDIQRLVAHLNDIASNRRLIGNNEREVLRGAIQTVLLAKRINARAHEPFVTSFGRCVEQIWGYKQLVAEAEYLRCTAYDPENDDHERKLRQLWELLMPGEQLEARVTKQWQTIGFQGDDPKTDFRGMGLLGLENLLFFATEYRTAAAHVLSHSLHPVYGYTFAIVGINLTSMAWQLLQGGEARTYVYNTSRSLPTIQRFHQFYSYLFYEFDRYWVECKPRNIMEFSAIRDRFEQNTRELLADPHNTFHMNVAVDTV